MFKLGCMIIALWPLLYSFLLLHTFVYSLISHCFKWSIDHYYLPIKSGKPETTAVDYYIFMYLFVFVLIVVGEYISQKLSVRLKFAT